VAAAFARGVRKDELNVNVFRSEADAHYRYSVRGIVRTRTRSGLDGDDDDYDHHDHRRGQRQPAVPRPTTDLTNFCDPVTENFHHSVNNRVPTRRVAIVR
jgi:hypothetical protein